MPRGVPVTLGIDALFCYGGAAPAGTIASCGAGSSSTAVPADTVLTAWEMIDLPAGNAYSDSRVVYTPSDIGEWQTVTPAYGLPDANNECGAGTVTGELTARVDVLCTGTPYDILAASGGTGGDPGIDWPDNVRWPTVPVVRTAASAANGGFGEPTGGDNAYASAVKPQPSSFTFSSLDTAVVDQVYLSGTAPFPINPTRWQRAAYTRAFATGFKAGLQATALLFDEDPFNLKGVCIEPPEQSVTSATFIKTPSTPGYYVRWVAITLQSGTKAVATGCVNVGAYGAPDTDGDCLEDSLDPNDTNTDTDGDLLLDGVEYANFSCVTIADVDADSATDFDEMFNFTKPNGGVNPCTASTACSVLFPGSHDIDPVTPGIQSSPFTDANDTDCDGQKDKWETGAGGIALDANDDDNCPADFNPQQENSDADSQNHSMGVGTGDASNPDQDWAGDVCDWDRDNDGLGNYVESILRIRPWGPVAGLCAYSISGTIPTAITLDPLNGDSDFDLVLDGAECQLRSRPDLALKSVATCIASDPDGCAQPNNGVAGGAANDPDGDGLFMPLCSICHNTVEFYYRTMWPVADFDADGAIGTADKDSDRDHPNGSGISVWLQDGLESLFYGTKNRSTDTDGDGCNDVAEVVDINGDHKVTAGDQLSWVNKKSQAPDPGKLDPDNDGDIDYLDRVNQDFNKNRSLDAGDQLLIAAVIATPGQCSTGQGASSVRNGSYP